MLESELRKNGRERSRILVHELFHFVWARLGNPRRSAYAQMLRREMSAHARGELGWSSEERKDRLAGAVQGALWRVYVCESFCDTAAFLYAGCKKHKEFTLTERWRRARERWFHESLGGRTLSI